MSPAGIAAVSWVALTTVVVRSTPFQRTRDALTKLFPVTVRVNAGPPAVTVPGATPVTLGTGLDPVPVETVNGRAPDTPPPGAGLATVTCTVPAQRCRRPGSLPVAPCR